MLFRIASKSPIPRRSTASASQEPRDEQDQDGDLPSDGNLAEVKTILDKLEAGDHIASDKLANMVSDFYFT
jgi:hypothetical protein